MDFYARQYDPQLGRFNSVDALANKFASMSPYSAMANNPIFYVDPDGREIIGVTKKDAQNFRDDIMKVLADDKFSGVRELITVKGKQFNKIDNDALIKALDGITLSDDERTYVEMVTNTINSNEVHKVEYVNYSDDISFDGATLFKNYLNNAQAGSGDALLTPEGNLKAITLSLFGGEGFNMPTKNGSHSIIIIGVPNSNTERAVTSGHETFGHGIPSSRKESDANNNTNAIRTDNLIRRILNLPQRDGLDHAGGKEGQIADPQKIPYTK